MTSLKNVVLSEDLSSSHGNEFLYRVLALFEASASVLNLWLRHKISSNQPISDYLNHLQETLTHTQTVHSICKRFSLSLEQFIAFFLTLLRALRELPMNLIIQFLNFTKVNFYWSFTSKHVNIDSNTLLTFVNTLNNTDCIFPYTACY